MGIGDIICEYIYSSFLLLKAALEVAQKTSKALLKALDTLFNTLLAWCRFVVDVMIKSVLDAIRVFQKWLVDQLLNLDFSALCEGMFRCTELLEQVLDPNSLLTRALKKFTNYQGASQEEMYKIVGDFKEFKNTICNFGFTFNFGLSAIKSMLNTYAAMCERIFKMLERNKERIRRFIQKYIDTLIDIGVFDMLDRLKKFFDCVLIDTDICSNIRTANSFYNTMLSKMWIEDSGDGYKIQTDKAAYYMNIFDSRINQLNNAKQDLQRLIDSMMSPSQVIAAKNAFNISANIFPGGMTWTDIKNGNWSNNKCYNYFKIKRREFIKALKTDFSETKNMSTDTILGGLKINDKEGTVTLSISYKETDEDKTKIITKTYTKDNMLDGMEYKYDGDAEFYLNNDGNDYELNGALFDKDNNEIMSNLRGAIEISIHNNESLKAQVQKKFNLNGYTREDELMKTF